MEQPTNNTTDFGFKKINATLKEKMVSDIFQSVANKYDLMNDLMSFGIHRLWKQMTIQSTAARPGQNILDIAGGTGDIAAGLSPIVGKTGCVVLADINAAMLKVGRNKLIDNGHYSNIKFVQANAEHLPFASNQFHCATMAFGLRNVTNKAKALASIYSILKPGGRLLVLEFSNSIKLPMLQKIYDTYSFKILPWLGERITGDSDSYRYLAESIRTYPDPDTITGMMQQAGFVKTNYQYITGGIVSLHKGIKA